MLFLPPLHHGVDEARHERRCRTSDPRRASRCAMCLLRGMRSFLSIDRARARPSLATRASERPLDPAASPPRPSWSWCRTSSGSACARRRRGVQRAAHDVVAHAREILHAPAADEHDRVLLEVVPFARDVAGDLDAVGEPDARDLAERRVRLLRRGGVHARAHAPLLRAALAAPARRSSLRIRRRPLRTSWFSVGTNVLHGGRSRGLTAQQRKLTGFGHGSTCAATAVEPDRKHCAPWPRRPDPAESFRTPSADVRQAVFDSSVLGSTAAAGRPASRDSSLEPAGTPACRCRPGSGAR